MTKVTVQCEGVLAAIPYFRGLPAADLRRLATLGEVPLLDGGGYVATAIAAEPSRVLHLPRDAVLDACRRHPEVALGIIRVLARRVRTFAGLVEQLSLKDLTARTAGLLVAESRTAGAATFELNATREELAARLGTVRELVSRALARLRKAGLIRVAGRRVMILDPSGLADLAEGR